MSEDLTNKYFNSDSAKLDLILASLKRLQEDLHMAKCEIKASIRDVARQQNFVQDSLIKMRVGFSDVDERLHGIELRQERENSST